MQIESFLKPFAEIFSDKKRCGCYCLRPSEVLNFPPRTHASLPLKHIDYQIEICNGLASITLEQKYINPTEKFLQIEFSFPIEPNACIYRYIAQFGSTRIQGIVKQKQEAKKQYQKAISQGKQASYAQIDPNNKDIMNMQIGNIAPGEEVKIIISYLQQLNIEQNTFYQFHLPATISPRYMNSHIGKKYNPDIKPAVGEYTWSFKISLQTTRKIIFQQSKSHNLDVLSQNQASNQTILVLAQQQIPNKDLHFLFTTEDFHLPNYVLGKTDYSSTVMLSFIPKFCELNVDDAMKASLSNKQMQTDINATKGEYVFFLDRSGSMGGDRIKKAKQALVLFLRSLPQNTYFNVVSFGSNSERLFSDSAKFDKNNLEKAIQKINKMNADMGGTEIYNCLFNELKKKIIQGYPKQVFLLTDGGVSNTQEVIKLVEQYTKYSRCHSIGIGYGCSQALIKGCAEKGKGKFIFISDNENPSEKIIGLLEQTLTPVIDNVKLKYDSKRVESIVPNPESIPYILKNEVVNFYVSFNGPLDKQTEFSFSYKDSMNKVLYESTIQVDPESHNMPFVDKMAHNKVIKNFETAFKKNTGVEDLMYFVKSPSNKKQEAIKHSVKHQILSQFTAFICVNKQLVDGKYQQIQQKGTDKINIQNILPVQLQLNEQALQLKNQNFMCSSNILTKKMDKINAQLKSMPRAPLKQSLDIVKKCKKTSTFSIGNSFSAMTSSIAKGVVGLFKSKQSEVKDKFKSEKRSLWKEEQAESCKYEISECSLPQIQKMKCAIECEEEQCDDDQMNLKEEVDIFNFSSNNNYNKNSQQPSSIQTLYLDLPLSIPSSVIKHSDIIKIQDIISQQNIDGSFDSQKLIQSLISKDQFSKAMIEAKNVDIKSIAVILSYLVGKWIEMYHPEKQYALIVKKIYSFVKRTNKIQELSFLDKYIIRI